MAGAKLKIGIGIEDQGLKQTLTQDAKSVEDFGRKSQSMASEIEDAAQKQAKIIAQGGNYRFELKNLTKEIQNYTMALRSMSDADKNGAVGQAVAEKLAAAKERAAELKDTIGDLNQEITNMASDTANIDAFNQTIGIARDTVSAFITVSGLFGTEQKQLEATLRDLAAVMTVSNAAISVANALQKQSAVMSRIVSLQKKAEAKSIALATAATKAQAAATKVAIVQQRLFNLAAKANPYVLLATAIIGVGAALYGFIKYSQKARAEQEKHNKAVEESRKKMQQFIDREKELAGESESVRVKFYMLTEQYRLLKNEAEKKKFIEDNSSAFHALGLEINSVTAADKIFIKNTDKVVAALIARAVAAKKASQAADQLEELEKKYKGEDRQFEGGSNISNNGKYYRKVKKQSDVSDDEARRAGVRTRAERAKYWTDPETGQDKYVGSDEFTKDEIKKIEKNREREARAVQRSVRARYDSEKKAIQDGVKEAVKAQYDADKALAQFQDPKKIKGSGGGSGKTTKKDEETPEKGSLADLRKQREELDKIRQNKTYAKHKTNADEVEKEIRRLDQLIQNEQFIIDFNTDPAKVELQTIEEQYNKLYARSRSAKIDTEDVKDRGQDMRTLNQTIVDRKYKIGADISPAMDSLIELQKKADEVLDKMSNPELAGADFSELERQYDDLMKQVSTKRTELGITIKPDEGSIDALQAQIKDLLDQRNALKLDVQTDESKAKIDELTGKINELRAQVNGAVTEYKIDTTAANVSLGMLEDRLTSMRKEITLSVGMDDESLKAAVDKCKELEKEIKDRKIKIGLEIDPNVEKLKDLDEKRSEMQMTPKVSSFKKAVPDEAPSAKDYEGQLAAIESEMDYNDSLLEQLKELQEEYAKLGEAGKEGYDQIGESIGQLNEKQDELGEKAKDVDKSNKNQKKLQKNWNAAADAVGNFGSALGSLGQMTDSPELNVAGIIAQGIAELALNGTKSLAACTTPWEYIAAAVGIIATITSVAA